jgi:thiol-disulfide isomerase/thioredoxin
MKYIFNLFVVVLLVFVTTRCSDSDKDITTNLPSNFEVSGQVLGAANQLIYIEVVSEKGRIKLAETTTDVDGSFDLKGNIKGMGLYQLTIGNKSNKSIPLTISPKEHVKIHANYASFERLPVISGTSWAPFITEYMRIFNEFAFQQIQLMNTPNLTEEQQLEKFYEIKKPLDNYSKSVLTKNPSNPAAIVLTTTLTPAMGFEKWDSTNLTLLKSVRNAYSKKYPSSPITKSLIQQVSQIELAFNQFTGKTSTNVVAPEILLPNPDGKIMSLSSLRGKVVLIDFWASWCGPCRRENPNVVALYKKYVNKGFTVFSVSLDSDVNAWKRAIKSDGLLWNTHVSDLKQWDTPLTKTYQFNAIPYTVLIDKDGKIVATNLRGQELENKILTLIK